MPPKKPLVIAGYDIAHRAKMAGAAARNPVKRLQAHQKLKRQRAINSLMREFPGVKTPAGLRSKLTAYLIHGNNKLRGNPPEYFARRINTIIQRKITSPRLSLRRIVYGT